MSVQQPAQKSSTSIWWQSVLTTFIFILGFSTVFFIAGGLAGTFGQALKEHKMIINTVAGVLIIAFGILLTGVIKIPFLMQESKFHVNRKGMGYVGAYFIGLAFAAGWSPCIGPILGSVIAMALSQPNKLASILLLMAYSFGLGLPFLITSMSVSGFLKFYSGIKKHLGVINLVAGLLLVVVGLAMVIPIPIPQSEGGGFTTPMGMFETWFRVVSDFDPTAGKQALDTEHLNFGSFLLAFLEGVLSFFTPCVLPMVPTFLAYVTGLSVQELSSLKAVDPKPAK